MDYSANNVTSDIKETKQVEQTITKNKVSLAERLIMFGGYWEGLVQISINNGLCPPLLRLQILQMGYS